MYGAYSNGMNSRKRSSASAAREPFDQTTMNLALSIPCFEQALWDDFTSLLGPRENFAVFNLVHSELEVGRNVL